MNKYKVAIVGSRNGVPESLVTAKLDDLLDRMSAAGREHELIVVSGGAKGVDTFAENWATRNNVPTQIFRADWHRYGRSAGPRRNEEIVEAADVVVAFTTGSKGTSHTISLAEKEGKAVQVYLVRNEGNSADDCSQEIDF